MVVQVVEGSMASTNADQCSFLFRKMNHESADKGEKLIMQKEQGVCNWMR